MIMKTRKQYIEGITEDMQIIRRKLVAQWSAKPYKLGDDKNLRIKITSSQWSALAIVMRHEKINITELAEMLGVTASAATQLVDQLVVKGYLVREDKVSDRRTLSLSLSNLCKKKISEMRAKHTDQFKYMFDVLSDKELEQYDSLNKKIIERILEK